ncbi:MAG: YeeE/YedE family protein [Gammaproteobacteria bacterium]|nr:MAG: YeeE/YedE family protein [Gammaproteobacteria bacterium]
MIFESFFSAHSTVLWATFGIAFILGAVVHKTNFCTMGAVSDMVNIGDSGRIRAWLFAIAVAMIGVAVMEATGVASMDSTLPPYRGSTLVWGEYILGGLMFGVGMTMGSGCANKTLIRMGGGNLKSIIVFSVIAVIAFYMLNPFPDSDQTLFSLLFEPWTRATVDGEITSPLTASLSTKQDLGSLFGPLLSMDTATARLWIGAVLGGLLVLFAIKSSDFRGSFDNILGGLVVGAAVLGIWYVTAHLVNIDADGESMSWSQYASAENWDLNEDDSDTRPRDAGVQSLTFINPTGQAMRLVYKDFDFAYLTVGLVALFGVIVGSFFWALISRSFRFEWFVDIKDFLNHVLGGTLMGFGGVLALGCTIGQGITGVSTLALGSFMALASIVFGSAMTMKIQYYKMVYEDEATFFRSFVTALADFRLLPGGMRRLEAI